MSGLSDGKYSDAFVCVPGWEYNRIGITRRISINCIKYYGYTGVGLGMYGIMEEYIYVRLCMYQQQQKGLNDWDKESAQGCTTYCLQCSDTEDVLG